MRIPRELVGPFASLLDGEWRSHRSELAAQARVWAAARGAVRHAPIAAVRVTAPGVGETLPEPETRPYGSRSGPGRSAPDGPDALPSVRVRASAETIAAWRAAARAERVSLAAWLRLAAQARATEHLSANRTAQAR